MYRQGREERVGSSGWVGALSQLVGFIEATRVGISSVKSEHFEWSAHRYKSYIGTLIQSRKQCQHRFEYDRKDCACSVHCAFQVY